MKHKIAICYSGGLDSLVMKGIAAADFPDSEVVLCYYDIGQDAHVQETRRATSDGATYRKLDWITDTQRPLETTFSGDIGRGAVMIPGRNAVLALLAACQELPDEVWLGSSLGEAASPVVHHDKDYFMYELMNPLFDWVLHQAKMTAKKPVLRYPIAEKGWTTPEAVKNLLDANVITIEELQNSHSCLFAHDRPCGACIKCALIWCVYLQLGISEYWMGVSHPMSNDHTKTLLMGIWNQRNSPNADVCDSACVVPALEKYFADAP